VHVIKTGCFGLGRKGSEFTTPRHGSTPTNCLKTTFSPLSISTVNNKKHVHVTVTLSCHTKGHSIGFTFSSPPGGTVAFTEKPSNSVTSHFKALSKNSPFVLDRASWCSLVCICVCVHLSLEENFRCLFLVPKTCFLPLIIPPLNGQMCSYRFYFKPEDDHVNQHESLHWLCACCLVFLFLI